MHALAPAKINLRLEVIGRREDGYHLLQTVMAPLTLADALDFSPAGEGVTLDCNDPNLPVDERNLAVRAARLLLDETGCTRGVHIRLAKHIPVAAGLGGGSSDAACTLLAVRKLLDLPVSDRRLHELAIGLGADVPFFLLGSAAVAEGIGERLRPYPVPRGLAVALVKPPAPLATADVYRALGWPLTHRVKATNLPPSFADKDTLVAWLRNDLEGPAVRLMPQILDTKEFLRASGAGGVLMSGSGPTVFGIFDDPVRTENACRQGQARGYWTCRCQLA